MAHLDRPTAHNGRPPARLSVDSGPLIAPGTGADGPPGVTLRRLLGLATLTPPQAVHIATEVLGLLDAPGAPTGADTDTVTVDRDGAVGLVPGQHRDEVGRTAELVDQLTRNADRPVARRYPTSVGLLAALSRCATALRDSDVIAARAALVQATGTAGLDPARSTHELAALVAVALRPSAALHRPEFTPQLPVPVTSQPVATASAPKRSRRRLVTTIVVAALAVAAVISTIALIRLGTAGPGDSPTSSPTSSPRAGSHATHHRPAHVASRRHELPILAPASARAISKVTLTPTAACRAGAACTLTVRIWLRPPWLSGFSWHAVAVDRCTHRLRRIGAGTMIARAGWQSAYATVALHLPATPRLAVVAVVDKPVSAASRPLLVNTGTRGCG